MGLQEILDDLTASGWTISWAFQYAPNEWRMSIIREADVGAEQGTYTTHCAFASSFQSALEDCLAKRNDALFEPNVESIGTIDNTPIPTRLDLSALGLRKTIKVERRI